MSLMGIQRNRSGNRVRSTLALVLVAMLNLVVQPCSMAMDADSGHPCPHCPVSVAGEHDMHAAPVADTADCEIIEAVSHDVRSAQFGQKDATDDLSVAVIELSSPRLPELPSGALVYRSSSGVPPGGPPLNVLYCVYLD